MPTDPAEVERLRTVVAPVQTRLLKLIDSRHKQPGQIAGSVLAELYERTYGESLDPQSLTGQSDLKAMLNRRNIFPQIGVRGSDKKGGWLIYRVVAVTKSDGEPAADRLCPPGLVKVQDNILELLRRAADPQARKTPEHYSDTLPHYSLAAGTLHERYGAELRSSFNFRNYGFSSLRAFVEACPKLAVVMKGKAGKTAMHIVARCSCCPNGMHRASVLGRGNNSTLLALKRGRDEEPPASSFAPPKEQIAADVDPSASAAAKANAGGDDESKAARKAAKRARKAAESGMSEAEYEAARLEAKERRKEKKAEGKAKKAAWLAAQAESKAGQ